MKRVMLISPQIPWLLPTTLESEGTADFQEKAEAQSMNATLRSQAAARRMIHPDQALWLAVETAGPLAPEQVPLEEACGLQLSDVCESE